LILKARVFDAGFFLGGLEACGYDDTMATKKKGTDAIKAAADYGIDISMLRDNLNRTPAERIKRHQAAFDAVKKLRKAKSK